MTEEDENGNVAAVEPMDTECYQFTWLGPEEDDLNNTRSCDFLVAQDIPCFEPLVWTKGPNRFNGPNLTQIETKCASQDTVDGQQCHPTCTKQDKSCVQMTFYQRDKGNTVLYQTHFCGTGTGNKGKVIDKGCHKQTNRDDVDVEVCFCQGDRCNGARAGNTISVVTSVFLATLLILVH